MAGLHRHNLALIRDTGIATLIALGVGSNLTADSDKATVTAESLLSTSQLAELSISICQAGELTTEFLESVREPDMANVTVASEPIRFRQTDIGKTVTVTATNTDQRLLEVQFLQPPGRPAQTNVTSYLPNTRSNKEADLLPDTRLSLTETCEIRTAHTLVYDHSQTPLYVTALDTSLKPAEERQWLNPKLPELSSTSADTVRVGLVDSGINYLLPEIASGLATDTQGNLIGYDFWDMDSKPFDANPARSPFFVQRHGTRTASIVLREAPGVKLVPYRYPRNAMTRMSDLIEHASALDIKVIGMPLGSNTYADWVDFESTAREHPHILFIVSAGNNGRDIDQRAVYPAAMDLKNMLVVTSADDFVHPAERTNFGRISVDYLVPAEQIDAIDFSGDTIKVSGSSYAVARVLALAARLLQQAPEQTVTDLMSSIRELSVRAETSRFVSIGYLGDPLASTDLSRLDISAGDQDLFKSVSGAAPNLTRNRVNTAATYFAMPLQLVRLDQRWNYTALNKAIDAANELYSQCNIRLEVDSVVEVSGPDYLMDLSSGHALTLSRAIDQSSAITQPPNTVTQVFLARDTAMLEQYDANAYGQGNTRNRPWMTNSLWLTHGIIDTEIALAHELFHITSNSGEHSTLAGNLMQTRTHPDNTTLTKDQCANAVQTGLAIGVLTQRG